MKYIKLWLVPYDRRGTLLSKAEYMRAVKDQYLHSADRRLLDMSKMKVLKVFKKAENDTYNPNDLRSMWAPYSRRVAPLLSDPNTNMVSFYID